VLSYSYRIFAITCRDCWDCWDCWDCRESDSSETGESAATHDVSPYCRTSTYMCTWSWPISR
jgi:hypothetical protein